MLTYKATKNEWLISTICKILIIKYDPQGPQQSCYIHDPGIHIIMSETKDITLIFTQETSDYSNRNLFISSRYI